MDSSVRTRLSRLLGRLRAEHGVTLPEMLAVLAILLVVLTPLVSSFTSALKHEIDQSQREGAYSSARLALQRMRTDVHCASAVTGVEENIYGGFTLTLTEAVEDDSGWCPAVIPAGTGASGVQWCTIPTDGTNTKFRLYRFLGLNPDECDGGVGSTFQVDYVTVPTSGWPTNTAVTGNTDWIGNLWPTADVCPSGRLPTLKVLLNTSVDPVNAAYRHYQLTESLALRNAVRC